MEKEAATTVLEYSLPPNRQKRIVRRILLSFLFLGIAGMLWWYRQPILARGKELYWFHRCMTHITPPGSVLLEVDPIKAGVLIKNNDDYVDDAGYLPPNSTTNSIRRISGVRAAYVPRELKELEKIFAFAPSSSGESTIYLGPIHTPAGEKRLLVLRADGSSYPHPGSDISIDLLDPPTATQSPQRVSLPVPIGFNDSSNLDYVWFLPGTLDPNDPTHISVPFEVFAYPNASVRPPKSSGILDIRLSNYNTLSFTERGKPEQPRVR